MGQNDLGMALRRYRIDGRINQAEVARILGVSQSQVSRWESGRDTPRAHNADAIAAMIWGRPDPQLAALIHFVETSSGPVALFDSAHRILAASRSLLIAGGPLQRFGWALDPTANPALAPVFRQYLALLRQPEGIIGLKLVVPFTHQDEGWIARAYKTICPLVPDPICIAEISFARDPGARNAVPTLERIAPSPHILQAAHMETAGIPVGTNGNGRTPGEGARPS